MPLAIPVPAVRGRYGDRIDIFSTTISVSEIYTLLGHDPRSNKWKVLPEELRSTYEKLQRKTTKARRESTERYITHRIGPKSYCIGAFPAIAIGVSEPQEFKPAWPDDPDRENFGTLMFVATPENRRILLDGLGRVSAAMDLWLDSSQPEEIRRFAGSMSLPVTIFAGTKERGELTIEHLGQLFHDFNVLGVPVSKGQAIDLDHSDIYIGLVNSLADLPVFKNNGGIDHRATKLGVNSKNLAVKSALLKFARAAMEGPGAHVDHIRDQIDNPNLTPDTLWDAITSIEDFLNHLQASMGPHFTNHTYIHLSNPGWVALGLLYHDLYVVLSDKITEQARATYVDRLGKIDWSPSNPDFLEFLGTAKLGDDGTPVTDQSGKKEIGRFYGGQRAFYNLAAYLRYKLGLDKMLPQEITTAGSPENFAVLLGGQKAA